MKLSDQQAIFTKNVVCLIYYLIDALGWKVVIGEVWRREVTQKWLFKKGWTKTLNSDHRHKLAVDLFVWIEGIFLDNAKENKEVMKSAGDYWKELHPKNYWGGDYKKFVDINHFGMNRIKEGT